jgi:hypothetical protein
MKSENNQSLQPIVIAPIYCLVLHALSLSKHYEDEGVVSSVEGEAKARNVSQIGCAVLAEPLAGGGRLIRSC